MEPGEGEPALLRVRKPRPSPLRGWCRAHLQEPGGVHPLQAGGWHRAPLWETWGCICRVLPTFRAPTDQALNCQMERLTKC